MLERIAPVSALRQVTPGAAPPVSNMELFFDLVYVFSIIQLSHYLLANLSVLGAVQFATLFAAVWWAWNYTAWAANWLNPDHPAGRLLMVFLMGCALLMAVAIPAAFTERAGLFVGAYVTMALVRAGYMALLFRGQTMGGNYAQLGAWSAISGMLWVAGAMHAEGRTLLWIAAVLVDYAAPYAGFWVPVRGATPMRSWPLSGMHLLERNQQVFIIALGESILLLGATLIQHELSAAVVAAAGTGFLLIVALWWLYFVQITESAEQAFEREQDQTRLARATLAYAHGLMVGGAVVVAVGIELIIAHPSEAVHLSTVLVAGAGLGIHLAGSALFCRCVSNLPLRGHVLAIVGLFLIFGVSLLGHAPGVVLGTAQVVALIALIAALRRIVATTH